MLTFFVCSKDKSSNERGHSCYVTNLRKGLKNLETHILLLETTQYDSAISQLRSDCVKNDNHVDLQMRLQM